MEMIVPLDLWPDVSDNVARRLIAVARSIAPCIDTLDGDPKADAIAVLLGVAAELPTPGAGRMRSQSRNGTAVTWSDYSSAFTADDRAALRALCGATAVGAPVGSFPASSMAQHVWPAEGSS